MRSHWRDTRYLQPDEHPVPFCGIDSHVGLANTLIVLSADHGGPDAPGYLKSLNIPAGYIEPDSWDKQAANSRIKDRFQIEGQLIERYEHPYVYLSTDVIKNQNIDREALEVAVVDEWGQATCVC